jgi:hypothetical protein
MNVFVSYTTRDNFINRDSLVQLSRVLSKFGDSFIDLIDNDSENKQERVETELEKADFVLLLRSGSVKHSKWVSWELNRAKEKGIPCIGVDIREKINPRYVARQVEYAILRERAFMPQLPRLSSTHI